MIYIEIAHVLQANAYVPLANIICDKLEWERKMKSKIFMLIRKALIFCWSLLIHMGLKVASKVVKENWEQVFMIDMKALTSIKTCSTYDRIQNDKQRLWEWDMICCCIVSNWKDLLYEINFVVKGSKQEKSEWDMSWCAYVVSNWKACIWN